MTSENAIENLPPLVKQTAYDVWYQKPLLGKQTFTASSNDFVATKCHWYQRAVDAIISLWSESLLLFTHVKREDHDLSKHTRKT